MIKSEQVVLFFLDIVYCFGVPNSITDNGTQLIGKKFLRFYDEYHIHVDWVAMAHPARTGRSSARTAWSYKASSLGSSTG